MRLRKGGRQPSIVVDQPFQQGFELRDQLRFVVRFFNTARGQPDKIAEGFDAVLIVQ